MQQPMNFANPDTLSESNSLEFSLGYDLSTTTTDREPADTDKTTNESSGTALGLGVYYVTKIAGPFHYLAGISYGNANEKVKNGSAAEVENGTSSLKLTLAHFRYIF